MKIRNSLVSNSSTSSFILNALMYSGVVTTPLLVGYIVYDKSETSIKNLCDLLKQKFVINKPVNEKM